MSNSFKTHLCMMMNMKMKSPLRKKMNGMMKNNSQLVMLKVALYKYSC